MALTDEQKSVLAADLIDSIPVFPQKAVLTTCGKYRLVYDEKAADLRQDAIITAHTLLGGI